MILSLRNVTVAKFTTDNVTLRNGHNSDSTVILLSSLNIAYLHVTLNSPSLGHLYYANRLECPIFDRHLDPPLQNRYFQWTLVLKTMLFNKNNSIYN